MTAPMYDHLGLHADQPGTMQTFTGRRVDPLHLLATDIDIIDIAHSLALQCRYNGHCFGHLSVARHSVWVSQAVGADPILKLWGLLHDAAEAYLGDMIRPLKHREGVAEAYLEAESRAEEAIAARFLLPFPMPVEIKDADNRIAIREVTSLRYSWTSIWQADEAVFMQRFQELWHERMGKRP